MNGVSLEKALETKLEMSDVDERRRLGEGEPLFGEKGSLEERGLGERESLERGLMEELGPASGTNPIGLGEDDPFEANRFWGDEGDRREANRS